MTAMTSPCWTQPEIDAEISRLEGFLETLPAVHEGQWAPFHFHTEIKAQIAVLRTGEQLPAYESAAAADAALWAWQWLYEGKETAPATGVSEEWQMFLEQLI